MKDFLSFLKFTGKFVGVVGLVCFGGFAIGLIGYNLALATDNQLGDTVRDGIGRCPVSSMSVDYSIDSPPKTQWVLLRCDGGIWGFTWLSNNAIDGWRQPQELLDHVKIGDAFDCARYRKISWIGRRQYFYYQDCELKS